MSWRDKYWRVWMRCDVCGNVRSYVQMRIHHVEPFVGDKLYKLCSPDNEGGKCLKQRFHTVLGGMEARMFEARAWSREKKDGVG